MSQFLSKYTFPSLQQRVYNLTGDSFVCCGRNDVAEAGNVLEGGGSILGVGRTIAVLAQAELSIDILTHACREGGVHFN